MIPRHEWKAQVIFYDDETGEIDTYVDTVFTTTPDPKEAESMATSPKGSDLFVRRTVADLSYIGKGAPSYETVELPF